MAVQAAPLDDLADHSCERVGNDAPNQKARDHDAKQIEFVFQAAILPCSGTCGS